MGFPLYVFICYMAANSHSHPANTYHDHPPWSDEETVALRGTETCPRSQRWAQTGLHNPRVSHLCAPPFCWGMDGLLGHGWAGKARIHYPRLTAFSLGLEVAVNELVSKEQSHSFHLECSEASFASLEPCHRALGLPHGQHGACLLEAGEPKTGLSSPPFSGPNHLGIFKSLMDLSGCRDLFIRLRLAARP